jgi:hypothetical protein
LLERPGVPRVVMTMAIRLMARPMMRSIPQAIPIAPHLIARERGR